MSETEELTHLRARVVFMEQQLVQSEQRRVAFADQVRCDAHSIATTIGVERPYDAAMEALALCSLAATEKHTVLMAQEKKDPNRYDLAALVASVDPNTPSDSETFWENED